jgi:hypothetical protein
MLVLLTVITSASYCSIARSVDTEVNTYEFLNYYFSRSEFPCVCTPKVFISDEYEPWIIDKADLDRLERMDSIFNKGDVDFIKQQFSELSEVRIDTAKVKSAKIISLDEFGTNGKEGSIKLWDLYEKKYDLNYFKVSRPLFSKDFKKLILISKQYTRAGYVGGVFVFVKKDNSWNCVYQWKMFVS